MYSVRFSLLGISLMMIVLLSACKKEEPELPSCSGIQWEYEGEAGPAHWASLCVDYTTCGGSSQSPIMFSAKAPDATLKALDRVSANTQTNLLNNGHTIQFITDAGTSLTLDGIQYNLVQFHTHTPAEHAPPSGSYPMEIHFVHQQPNTSNLAVIGVWVKEGASHPLLEWVADKLPRTPSATYASASLYDPSVLMPVNKSYYTYGGSLTTPPCSETVRWIVLSNPIEASAAQIQRFKELEPVNNRPLQAVGSRAIRWYKE